MDPNTAKLAIELQLTDIDDLLDSLYDTEDVPDGDARASFELMRSDLQEQLRILEGQILTLRILKEEHDNRITFSRLLEEERQAVADHQLAKRLAGVTGVEPKDDRDDEGNTTNFADGDTSLYDQSDTDQDEQWEMAKQLYAVAFDHKPVPPASSTIVKTGEVKANTGANILGSKALVKCCTCMDVVTSKNTLTLGCKPEAHTYCRGCLIDLFKSAIKNTSLFPPRCCRLPVPLDLCRALLPKELIKIFDLKVEELATPNPTYCSNADCAKFIRPSDIKADVATCAFCKDATCVRCKCPKHKGLCPSDPHVQLLMDFARRSRFQQCTKCKNMVELSSGCFHMTCRCNHSFCYLCGKKWKTCICPQADEHYLTRPLPEITTAPVAAPLHEHDWHHVNGVRCEYCGASRLPFVLRCSGCNIANCWRCIHNQE